MRSRPETRRRPVCGPRLAAGDTGSLPLALLLTLVGVMLSAVLVPVLLQQVESTRVATQRAHALHAAQAGLDVALGQIRAASDPAGNGVLARLPCGPLTGDVGAGGTARYQVTIDYLSVNPQGRTDAWITANRISCAGGGPSLIPAYALLRSVGTDQPAGPFTSGHRRSLRATYTFLTTNNGGLIHVYKTPTSLDLCLDAGSANPPAGTDVQVQPCRDGSAQQRFSYRPNLTLVLVSSATPGLPLGMCLDAGAPHAAGRLVQLLPCAAAARPQQQWIFNDHANFEGTADGIVPDGTCFNVQSRDVPGSFVVLGTAVPGCLGDPDNTQTFAPDGTVTTGAAGAAGGQLVNADQFSRCLNVTEGDVNFTYLTDWPCRQVTDPTSVPWYQRWAWPAIAIGTPSGTGRITVTAPTGQYCLRSPGSIARGRYVAVARCPAGATPQNMTWTVTANTGSYPTSYRITDGFGYCLSPTDPTARSPELYPGTQQISRMAVATCGGGRLQKWNAPPGTVQAFPLTDIGEP